MIVYVRLEVSLRGMERRSLDGLIAEIRSLLEPSFGGDYESDIEIATVEYAGQPEVDDLEIVRQRKS